MHTTPGVHHVTAVATDPQRNLEFYTGTLGLRLVKRSVNQDDYTVYHLFYGDRVGSPGTSVTFFPYPDTRQGRIGTGQVGATAFLVPEGSVGYWTDRFDERGVEYDDPVERFGDTVVGFRDPNGLRLELVAREDAPEGDPPAGEVPDEYAIRGFFGVTLSLASAGETERILEGIGYSHTGTEDGRRRYVSTGDLGYVVDVLEEPERGRGLPGAGTVHHVAFVVDGDEQEGWRERLSDLGLRPTEVIDREWFRSVYARTPGGVLFEFATKEPGYTVDEGVEDLGEGLVLPAWLKDRRDLIEGSLPELDTS